MSENRQQVEIAKATLKVFEDRGEDFADTRHVIHYFYGGNFGALGAALTELGYAVRPIVNDDGVVAERYEAIGESWRLSTLLHLCELADSYGVEYDGWEASMTRQTPSTTAAPTQPKPAGWTSPLFGKKK